MALNIISNYAAHVAHRNLVASDMAATASVAKLSAGTRVLSAKDDAAALAIGSRLSAEVAGLKQAGVNAGQAVSMLQIADGAMGKVQDILTRMKTLAVQAGSGQLSGTERGMLDKEYQALLSEVDRIANDTDFSTLKLVDGSFTSIDFKVGTGTTATEDVITVSIGGIDTTTLGVNGGDITSVANADTASTAITAAIDTLNTSRADVGASQNRFEFAAANIATAQENTEAARSNLLDLDIASEMSVFTSKQILVQTGVSMLAQANQLPQSLMRLFQ